ncbi:MAG: HAMP domain-containing histidine kinase [Pyrinomonadaceae bacterium]|nr:HAMP domain-containing histidine kinase [Pyrinomonadaceae bacterium]
MRNSRRGVTIFFLIFGSCLIGLAIALQVGWILFSLERVAVLIIGIIFFAAIITGLVLNTIFLIREIRRNEQQDAFLNAVTHELKTPIASIKLYLETLKTRDLSEEKRREFYDIMLKDNNRLLNTVEQVLQASRTRESREGLRNITKIEINSLLEEAVSVIKNRYHLQDEEMIFAKNESVFEISGDRNELLSVFTNLLDNAVKYSKDKIKVSVRARNLDRKNIIVRIRDEGIGIPTEEQKRVFKRFYRVANSMTQKKKGTGLGLFIVQSVIKNHGGKVFAESDGEGKGSVFTIQLPKA